MKTNLLFFLIIFTLPVVAAEETNNLTTSLEQLDKKLDDVLALPEKLEAPLKLVLGIKETGPINASLLILVAALWLVLMLIVANLLQLTSFFPRGTQWIGAIALVTIGSASGILEAAARGIQNVSQKITFFAEWSSGVLIVTLLILLGISLLIKVVLRPIKEHMQKIQAQNKGFIEGIREARRRMKEDISDEVAPVSKRLPDGSTITGPGL